MPQLSDFIRLENTSAEPIVVGDTRITPRPDQKKVARGFDVDDAMLADFKEYLRSQKVKVDDKAFATDAEFMRAMIHYDIDLALFGVSEARRTLVTRDPQAQLALQLFPEAERLSELRRAKVAVQQGGR